MENKEGNMETINYISHTHNPKVVGSNPAPATKQDGFSKPSFLFPIFSKMPENGLSMRFSNGNRNKLGKVESE